MNEPKTGQEPLQREVEHRGPMWKHPYFVYVILTAGIFAFLLIAGYLGLSEGWIPKR